MSNYVNVTVNYAETGWDTRFKILTPKNVCVGIYEGLEACAVLDKILISKEFSDKAVAYVSQSFSFKLLADFLCKVKDDYVSIGLVGVPAKFRVDIEAVGGHAPHDAVVDIRNPVTKLPWKSKLYIPGYPVVSSAATVFGYLGIVVVVDEGCNLKYKAVTDNTDFNKQMLGDFSSYNDIVSAKLEAEHLYEKYLKAWVTHANSNHLDVVVLEHGEGVLKLQTTIGDVTVIKVSQYVSNIGRMVFTGNLIMPWSDKRVPFVDRSVRKLASLVNDLIDDKVNRDLTLLMVIEGED